MPGVLAIAVVGIALLAAAVLTDNTIIALMVIVIAAVGLVLLAREWRDERPQSGSDRAQAGHDEAADDGAQQPEQVAHDDLEPDQFEPDVPYEDDSDPSTNGPEGDTA